MTQELIIEGQRVDLSTDTDIALEYTSSLFGDIGKIHSPRSYTIKLPRTANNARILDDAGAPGHESSMTRRYLTAQYYRNGIDLVGDGQAHILARTDESYEIALVWDNLTALRALSQSKKKLTDITGLGTLTWRGAALADNTSTDIAFYGGYDSGAWANATEVARHPAVTLSIVGSMLHQAGAAYQMSDRVAELLRTHAILAAPSHKPSLDMELYSGARATTLEYITTSGSGRYWWFTGWTRGWDAPQADDSSNSIKVGSEGFNIRIIMNVKLSKDAPNFHIKLESGGGDCILRPTRTADGGYLIDQEVDLRETLGVEHSADYYGINVVGVPNGATASAYSPTGYIFALIRPHETIKASKDNRFPVAENLPDIGQYEFIKAVMGLFGIAPVVKAGTLHLMTYDEILSKSEAVDWTEKVDMEGIDGIRNAGFTLSSRAQSNLITYETDKPLPIDPTIELTCDDATLDVQKEFLKLPFAASSGNEAKHYKCRDAWDDGNYYVGVEDIDIKPRIFGFNADANGKRQLFFTADLWGQGAIDAYHCRYQEIIRSPRTLKVGIRLNEIDLKQLDLSRAVYLAQYGQFYAVMKVQTSDTDLCKVELLQIS